MTLAATQTLSPAEVVLAYHARTKHRIERYAAGPETLDWDAQPNPFREFEGSVRTALPLSADRLGTSFEHIYAPDDADPLPLTIASVGMLLELSMGLSAWKELGPDRWALRCNPSSGNLHPTEAYLFCSGVPGLDDGLYHYVSREHALELRCRPTGPPDTPARLWIGLSSVYWREAWKYGERGFRYCQLDIGHALGAIRYAAGALGWTARMISDVGSGELATWMGLDRPQDFPGVEPEEADLLIAIDAASGACADRVDNPLGAGEPAADRWTGHANLLDPHPIYRWPVIQQVSQASRGRAGDAPFHAPDYPPLHQSSNAKAADVILGRRSAQRFASKFVMKAQDFHRLLDSLLVRRNAPWDIWSFSPRLHAIFFIHRVEGLRPGLYALPRHPEAAHMLRDSLRPDFEWQAPENVPEHLPLVRLLAADCQAVAKTMNCHQAIASDGCFTVSLLSEFEPVIRSNTWRYRQLHWEAGLLGHVLYLEAEAAGLRGTGIGCYFDDALHGILGIANQQFQSLYHFTIGLPITDQRIVTSPPYPGRSVAPREES
jgi:nitroreductase